ncbi:MAG: hypothetical protein PHT19_01225 [Methylococcus sp.]|nr:hypothetical protein [Methylococcus sp.]
MGNLHLGDFSILSGSKPTTMVQNGLNIFGISRWVFDGLAPASSGTAGNGDGYAEGDAVGSGVG